MVEKRFTLREQPARRFVSLRLAPPASEVGPWIDRSLEQLRRFLAERGVEPVGPPVVISYGRAEIEVCLEVGEPVAGEGEIESLERPAEVVVTTTYVGSPPGLATTYQALTDWLDTQGYDTAAPPREVYVDRSDPDHVEVEINWPIQHVGPV